MARHCEVEYTTVNPADREGSKTWPWFIGFLVFIIILKVLS